MKKEIIFSKELSPRRAASLAQETKERIKKYALLEKDCRRVNGKTLIGLLSLDVKTNDVVTIVCENEEDLKELEKIIIYIQEEF
jgi:phosphotransferase system HPr-like phosphotransfer protein